MSIESRRGSTVIRQVLKEVIHNEIPASSKRAQDIEKAKLKEVVIFLEKKIDRQHSEIKIISEQLSKEISIKEELLQSLNEEKEKCNRLSQHLATANRNNSELKGRLAKTKVEATLNEKEDFEMKINKYQDIVRKKDELLTKNQQKLEELLKKERNFSQLQFELKSIREAFGRLKHREESLSGQVEKLRQKVNESNEKIRQKDEKMKQKDEQLKLKEEKILFTEELLKRMKEQYAILLKQHEEDHQEFLRHQQNSQRLLEEQASEIQRLSVTTFQPFGPEETKWDLSVFKKQAKRTLQTLVKDCSLRRRVQKEMVQLLSQVQASFSHILQKILQMR